MSYTETINSAVKQLKKGNLIVYPTETVYGIGADASNIEAINKIYKIKGRSLEKKLVYNISNIEMLMNVAQITNDALVLMETFWPGPLTIILNSINGGETIGFRMPNNKITLEIIAAFGSPICGTSANISGSPASIDVDMARKYFLDTDTYTIDDGPSKTGIASTILDMSNPKEYKILREGGITLEEIMGLLE